MRRREVGETQREPSGLIRTSKPEISQNFFEGYEDGGDSIFTSAGKRSRTHTSIYFEKRKRIENNITYEGNYEPLLKPNALVCFGGSVDRHYHLVIVTTLITGSL